MVKPLNKEWELFGAKYRIPDAKGDKVDCNACQKQVSAAVNRLQSHMRVCPARSALSAAMDESAKQQQQLHAFGAKQQQLHEFDANGSHVMDHVDRMGDATELTDGTLDSNGGALSAASQAFLTGGSAAPTEAGAAQDATSSAVADLTTATSASAAKRQKTSPTRAREQTRWNPVVIDDMWLTGVPQPSSSLTSSSSASASSAAYAKRRLELEEKRLLLEMKKDQREERRELYHLEILEAQARKERLVAEKEGYEAKVLLALSRKQLRDQGVSEDEIDRILPVDTTTSALVAAAVATAAAPAAENQC
ncbi:hypothetical protein Gpo141_00003419 [Globisporangium polare]